MQEKSQVGGLFHHPGTKPPLPYGVSRVPCPCHLLTSQNRVRSRVHKQSKPRQTACTAVPPACLPKGIRLNPNPKPFFVAHAEALRPRCMSVIPHPRCKNFNSLACHQLPDTRQNPWQLQQQVIVNTPYTACMPLQGPIRCHACNPSEVHMCLGPNTTRLCCNLQPTTALHTPTHHTTPNITATSAVTRDSWMQQNTQLRQHPATVLRC